MKFTVREGFVVAYTDRIKQGDKTVERDFSYYPEDGAIELDKDHAVAHAHKLEGADKDGKTFLETLAVATAPAQALASTVDVAAIVTAAVQAALAAQAATVAAAGAGKSPGA